MQTPLEHIATSENIQDLLNKGFKPFRKIYNKETKDFNYIETDINLTYLRANFNTQIPGGTGIFLKKDNEEYFFGLNIKDEPIALIKQPETNN